MNDASTVDELETIDQVREDLPDAGFIQSRESTTVRPEEAAKVAKLA